MLRVTSICAWLITVQRKKPERSESHKKTQLELDGLKANMEQFRLEMSRMGGMQQHSYGHQPQFHQSQPNPYGFQMPVSQPNPYGLQQQFAPSAYQFSNGFGQYQQHRQPPMGGIQPSQPSRFGQPTYVHQSAAGAAESAAGVLSLRVGGRTLSTGSKLQWFVSCVEPVVVSQPDTKRSITVTTVDQWAQVLTQTRELHDGEGLGSGKIHTRMGRSKASVIQFLQTVHAFQQYNASHPPPNQFHIDEWRGKLLNDLLSHFFGPGSSLSSVGRGRKSMSLYIGMFSFCCIHSCGVYSFLVATRRVWNLTYQPF